MPVIEKGLVGCHVVSPLFLAIIALVFEAADQLVALRPCRHQLCLAAPPAGQASIVITYLWLAGVRTGIDRVEAEAVFSPEQARGNFGVGREAARVAQIGVGLLVGLLVVRVVEHDTIRGTRVAVLPLAPGSRQGQSLLRQARIEAAAAVEGGAGRATEAGFGHIELGKAEIGTLTVASRYRSDDFGTVVETLAISGPAVHRAETRIGRTYFDAVDLLRCSSDDVDHAKQRIAAVDRRAGSAYDLDPFDQIDIDQLLATDVGRVVNGVVGPLAVDQQQHARVVVLRSGEAARPDIVVGTVAMDVKAWHAADRFGHGAPPVLLDVFAADDGYRRRGCRDSLAESGSADD
jgi:hypothetical protein